MKDIFKRKTFWTLLIILLLAVFVYPPFIEGRYGSERRSWGWFFLSDMGVVDLKMLLVEAIIATLLSVGICSITFREIGRFLFTKRQILRPKSGKGNQGRGSNSGRGGKTVKGLLVGLISLLILLAFLLLKWGDHLVSDQPIAPTAKIPKAPSKIDLSKLPVKSPDQPR